jgi:hypothetical protein
MILKAQISWRSAAPLKEHSPACSGMNIPTRKHPLPLATQLQRASWLSARTAHWLLPGRSSGYAASYQTGSAASKELTFKNNRPLRAAPDVLERDAARFDSALVAWFSSGCTADTSTRKEPAMSKFVEIQVQSTTDGSGFVAQWYADGERSGQAFPLFNTGELLFFAYFTDAPMIVPDDATRAMLHERGVGTLSAAS